jgi:antirestriction protein ArdC
MSVSNGPPADWSAMLADAVAKPGVISQAYRTFWNYSFLNSLLAVMQCHERSLPIGPLNTFLGWRNVGRSVKKGEKAIILCMPVTVKNRPRSDSPVEPTKEGETPTSPGGRTVFVYKPHWFVLAQTDGEPYHPTELPEWSEERTLSVLGIHRTDFGLLDGNAQGYATGKLIAVSPIAYAPHRTLFHELAHVVLGHTAEADRFDDGDERTPRNIREVEAEGVALICCESLGFPGTEFSRGYLQHWLGAQEIPERSIQKIFKAADTILKAGHPASDNATSEKKAESHETVPTAR